MTQQAHSKLGASSASRWLNCPGSVKLSEALPPQPSSEYALEGTAAHALAELCLTRPADPAGYVDTEIPFGEPLLSYTVSENMAEAVQIYIDYVCSKIKLGGRLSVETRFSLDFIEKGMFGTNDACIYNELLGTLEVIDYKHGAGITVSPVENAQLAYYGLGAAKLYKLHPNSTIILTIVQPRANGEAIKSWTTTVGYLENFAKILKAGAKATKAKNPKLAEGSWCKFCPAQAVCPQLYKKAMEVAQAEFSQGNGEGQIILPAPEALAPVDLKKVLDFSDTLSSWLRAVETYAFNSLERGEKVEGYKLVKKRSNRKWKLSEEAVVAQLKQTLGLTLQGCPQFYSEPKLKSPAQIEALKIDKNLVASLCESPDNGNTIAPVSDKRPEVLPAIHSDFTVIEESE